MKKILTIAVFAISILIINNLIRSIWNLLGKQEVMVNAQRQLEKEKEKNKKLKDELLKASSASFIEQEARNKLFLVKPGEQQVIISQDLLKATDSSKEVKTDTRPNWRKWWDLFFK